MKKRFIIFTVLSVVSAVFTLIFAASFCEMTAIKTDFAENVDEITFDGTDFTPIFKTGASLLDVFMSSVVPVIFFILFFIALILLNAATFGFFRLFGLRGELDVNAEELRITRKLYVIFTAAAAAITLMIELCCVIFGRIPPYCFFGLLFCWPYPLFAWVFCLRRLKSSV